MGGSALGYRFLICGAVYIDSLHLTLRKCASGLGPVHALRQSLTAASARAPEECSLLTELREISNAVQPILFEDYATCSASWFILLLPLSVLSQTPITLRKTYGYTSVGDCSALFVCPALLNEPEIGSLARSLPWSLNMRGAGAFSLTTAPRHGINHPSLLHVMLSRWCKVSL